MDISGVITAIPTPLDENEKIDAKSLCRLIDYVIGEGADGIMMLGSMGEGTALLDSEKIAAVEIATAHLNKRKPLIVTISDCSTKRVLNNAKMLEKFKPDFFSATTTFYYKHPAPESFINYVRAVSENISCPFVFYNAPGATGNTVDVDTLEKAMSLNNVAGVKDSSGNFNAVMELLRRHPDKHKRPFFIMQGDESVFDVSLLMGADGIVTGGGTCFVKLVKELYNACQEKQVEKAYRLQQKFFKELMTMIGSNLLIDWMYKIKQDLYTKGICSANVTAPFLKRD